MELNSTEDRLLKYEAIDRELIRAKKLYPTFPTNVFEQTCIMMEEAGEVVKAANDFVYEKGDKAELLMLLKDEVIQTAAMCMRMLESIEKSYWHVTK
ncbi:hypothetical protein [Paludibacter sp.]|jgi:hypothetical protein|uniref:hypothetical protein n=1 Tax=Paludibacter sp. TaxID=1898105 RepID=UPI001355708E|nr:hypothetical protein [Paludibacter sp.]MTK53314.1 hypothetical protein [Paludibacter sp.]